MKIEEHKEILKKIALSESEADRRTLLQTLETDYSDLSAQLNKTTKDLESMTHERDTFRDSNNKLWLQMGQQNTLIGKEDAKEINENIDSGNEAPAKIEVKDFNFK